MKLGGAHLIGRRCILYIPLRSDETFRSAIASASVVLDFISHYVQMKHWGLRDYGVDGQIFISHYVQMKLVQLMRTLQSSFRLYIPLRSDETCTKVITCDRIVTLYIPLRSDETLFRDRLHVAVLFFISHYVQMKRSWPRRRRGSRNLYIPLRSDETTSKSTAK